MANHCIFCDTRRPVDGTTILVLNGGEFWAEFCPLCGETETLHNPETGETITLAALFNRNTEGKVCPKADPARVAAFLEAKEAAKANQAKHRAEMDEFIATLKAKEAAKEAKRKANFRGGIGSQPLQYC